MEEYKIYVTKELAIKAKEKGFSLNNTSYTDGWIKQFWVANPKYDREAWIKGDKSNPPGWYYDTPTVEQIREWLRTEKDLFITDKFDIFDGVIAYEVGICSMKTGIEINAIYGQNYTELLFEIINKALDLI